MSNQYLMSSSELSKVSETCANPTGFLNCVPANITSSIFPPLRVFTLCSPRTHLTESDILLFPLPLGPTTAVTPFLNFNSVLSAKDLNPLISNGF